LKYLAQMKFNSPFLNLEKASNLPVR